MKAGATLLILIVWIAIFVLLVWFDPLRTGAARNNYCIEAGGVPINPKTCIRPEALIPVQP